MKYYLKILIFLVVLLNFSQVQAQGASLFFTKSSNQIEEGENITIDVRVKSSEEPINAVSGVLSFSNDLLGVTSISRDGSVLNIWTKDPSISRNTISFEGVILTPGYKGDGELLFKIFFKSRKSGIARISFTEGALLANDGLGTNIITSLNSTDINITKGNITNEEYKDQPITKTKPQNKILALPVITEYSQSILSSSQGYIQGKGEPSALTKITFEDISNKSFGEQFMDFIQHKKKRLTDVLVRNDEKGIFEYTTPNNLIAGVYNATPFLVDDETKIGKPGLGVRFLVNDSKIVKALIVFINVLLLLIPIVGLIMVIYFIPWYSSKRMRIIKRKMGLEEEEIELTEHKLKRQDQLLDREMERNINSINAINK